MGRGKEGDEWDEKDESFLAVGCGLGAVQGEKERCN